MAWPMGRRDAALGRYLSKGAIKSGESNPMTSFETRISRRGVVLGAAATAALPLITHSSLKTISLTSVAVAQSSKGDVPMFRGNLARTGEMPGPGPDPSRGLEAIWKFASGPSDHPYISTPAVVDGSIYFGSGDKNVYALDAKTGEERWRFATNNVNSSPAVVDGTVYIGSDDKNFYALDAKTGVELWRLVTRFWVAS